MGILAITALSSFSRPFQQNFPPRPLFLWATSTWCHLLTRLLQHGTVLHTAIHAHRFIKRLEGKKKPTPKSTEQFLLPLSQCEENETKRCKEDHSQCLQVVGRTLCNVTFLKGKSLSAQKKETAGEGRHLCLLVRSGYAQTVRHFESYFWDD